MSGRRGPDELVVFPTPKEAFGRASQQQQYQQQQQAQQMQLTHHMRTKPQRKPPPTINNHGHGGLYSIPSQQTYPNQRPHTQQFAQRPPAQSFSSQPPAGYHSGNGYQQQHPQQRVPGPPQHPSQQLRVAASAPGLSPVSPQRSHGPALMSPQQMQSAPVQPPQHSSPGALQTIPQQFTSDGMHLYQQQPPQELRQPNPLARQNTSDAERLELQLRELFKKVDRDNSGYLTEKELSLALYNTDKTQFQASTVRVMIKLFDKDGAGVIDFRQFYHLWNYISHWRKVFALYDKDKSNTITFSEYQETLKSFGYRLPTDTVLFVFQRFSHGGSGVYLKFDSYVESLIWLLRCTNSFKKFDLQETGVAVFPFDKYIQEVLGFQ